MALGGPLAHPASHSLSRVAVGVGRKVSCWVALRHLLLVLAATHPTVLVFCCVCLSLFGVCRDRIEASDAFRLTDWAAGSS